MSIAQFLFHFYLLIVSITSLQVQSLSAQMLLLSEDVGNPAIVTQVSTYNGWQTLGNFQYNGNIDVRSTNPSATYIQASGGGNLFFSANPGQYFEIANVPTSSVVSFQLSFGIFKSTTQSDGSDFVIEYCLDGGVYRSLSFALTSGVGTSVWTRISLSFTTSSATFIGLRFRQTGSTTYYRLDDLSLIQNSVLPIEMHEFSVIKESVGNQLRWTTASEINNSGFEVQRSADGQNYQSIGFVNSQATGGNSQSQLKYKFTDVNPTGIKQYYRLRQFDIDGRSTLSNILLIQGEKPTSLEIASVYPNPARLLVTLLLNAPDNRSVKIQLVDLAGRILQTRQVNVLAGSNSIPFDLSSLAIGQYLISVDGKGVKVVKE